MKKCEEFRKCVPAANTQSYFDSAETGLIPDFVHDAVQRYQEQRYQEGGDALWAYDDGPEISTLEMMERSKKAIAKMIGASAEEIAFGQNSSHMYTLFTSGLDFEKGDNIILPEDSWISNRYAWQIRQQEGLEIRYVKMHRGEISVEECTSLCDERTKAICMPFVEPSTGFTVDVETIGNFCKKKNIWFVVDGVQAIGILPIDVKKMNIDFLVGNDYKWMMNYCGTGLAYISKPLQTALIQRSAGWMSDNERFNTGKKELQLRDDAGRFELGFLTTSGIYGMGLVAEKYVQLGAVNIKNYVFALINYLKTEIDKINGVRLLYDFSEENKSAITFLVFESSLRLSNEKLEEERIHVKVKPFDCQGRQIMRVSIHYYNNKEDIDRLIRFIK